MRKLHTLLASASLAGSLLVSGSVANAATKAPAKAPSAAAACVTAHASSLHASKTLTIATDNPVYEPWFSNNKPTNGKGYESAFAYALATELGFTAKQVKWVTVPFDSSYQPGPKAFDFDLNEVSYTDARAQVVSFSKSYYDVTQSIIALKSNRIVKHHTSADLKTYRYGDQIGTTGYDYIVNNLKPTKTPSVYNTLEDAVLALKAKQIDAIVVDTPTGQYMASDWSGEFKKGTATQVGQFPTTGEHFGALFQKDSPLVACVNLGIDQLNAKKTLKTLQAKYLGIYNKVAKIKP
jgi:polar amino acid transport system substrate-binding protein